jgi:hypothetical protein
VSALVLLVDDEPDVEAMFRQRFDFTLPRGEIDARAARVNQTPYSAISAGGVAGPASGRSSIATMQSAAVAISTAAAPNT